MFSAEAIVRLQDELTKEWHNNAGANLGAGEEFLTLAASQHRANYDLWHTEDEARRPGATDEQIADVKRRIDATNQLRNDLAEKIDLALLAFLAQKELPRADAPLNSESPGLIVDRLSILALKIFHTREEGRAHKRAARPRGAQSRAAQHSRRAARRSGGLFRRALARDARRNSPLQTLPPAQDVQRPGAESGHL